MASQQPQTAGVKKKRWIACFESSVLDLDLSVYEKMVYIVLCAHAKKDGPAFPSIRTIAREASCSRTKVFEALNALEEQGLISRENQIFPKRGQTSNLYEIMDIEPRQPGGQDGGDSTPPSAIRTGEPAARTGGVPGADAPLDVFEQDPMNSTTEQEDPPLPPKGEGPGVTQPGREETEKSMTQPGEMGKPASNQDPGSPGLTGAILEAYNRILPELPKAGSTVQSRERAVKRRIREDGRRGDPRWWEGYFARVREFPWLMGNNPSGWRACLDWLIGERGMLKVLEGGFGRSSPGGAGCGTDPGAELQKKYTGANGVVDVKSLLRELECETA
jgi:predicted transcriptional regulator